MDSTPRPARDYWPYVLGLAHAAHTLWFASVYPEVVYDPDLIAYFVYFKNWITGSTALHGTSYFTVPKPLLVFLLGPLDNAPAAFAVSAICAGLFGALIYLICRRVFGRNTAILCSAVLLLDVDRVTLSARVSADFFLAFLLYASIEAALVRRYVLSGIAIALAGLVKPVALPCIIQLLAVEGEDRKRAWASAAIPLVALPLILLSNHALLGSAFGTQRFFSGFAAMSDGTQMATGDLLRFVLWVELAKTVFTVTAPFGVIGLCVWLGRDKQRLTNPFFLTPLALLAGYVVLSITTPFIAFFRFFWTVQVWFSCFVVYGIVETCRRLAPDRRGLRVGIAAALLFFVFDEQMSRQLHYRSHFAGPFEEAMRFVGTTDGLLAAGRAPGETILTPLAFLPYLLWTIDDARTHPSLIRTAEMEEETGPQEPPDWVLYVPLAFLRQGTRERVDALLGSGLYVPLVMGDDAVGALYVRRDRRQPLARR
jgi:hypothetical protein